MIEDRTVYASAPGIEVVRYDKAGKWYIEMAADYGRRGLPAQRTRVELTYAAETARNIGRRPGGEIKLGLPGGEIFDRLVNE